MNEYMEMRNRQQKEFDALPLGFAFNNRQFAEMMREWGLDPEKDVDKIYSIGFGGYVQKKDTELLHQTRDRHDKEMGDAIAGDKTGNGFIYEMFLYELDDHEYGYTRDMGPTLDALGYTAEEVRADKRLFRGLQRACKEISRRPERK